METPNIVLTTPDQLKSIIAEVIKEHSSEIPTTKSDILEEIYLSNKEVQRLLNISHVTVFDWINKGKLNPVRMGKKLLFKKSDLVK